MRESVTYQDILAEGEAKGKIIGVSEGLEQGLQQERALVIRQLTRKLGEVSSGLIDRLESLGEALLDFTRRGRDI